jgi:glutaredoxin 3
MARVIMYTTQVCPYCHAAKALLREKGVAFEERDVSGDGEKRTWLVKATGQRTVPQIFVNGKPLGGFSDISALDERDELDLLLAEPDIDVELPR